MSRWLAAVVVAVSVGSVPASAADRVAVTVHSGELARQLTQMLTDRHFDAIAAREPGTDDRYVAALFYPNAQLLVVSAESASPAVAQAVDSGAFRDAYAALHQTATPATKLFIVDMGADGLHVNDKQLTDILYDHVTEQVTLDGNPDSRQPHYEDMLAQADERYCRLLQILLDSARSE